LKTNPTRWDKLLDEAEALLPRYVALTSELPHARKGIRRSELLFFYALAARHQPTRIIESGRARAQSTLTLSRLFPHASIVSVEVDPNSADVAMAAERLRGCANVDCQFGDSIRVLPELVAPGDIVLIDGPKGFRALKLALRLLRTGHVSAVFVHDLWLGSTTRRFVDRTLPSALLSDEPRWVERYATVDSNKAIPSPAKPGERRAYGATLGYFEGGAENYTIKLLQCTLAQGSDRLRDNARKFLHHPPSVRPDDFASE
jgi:predicted O-methyltransferase YrrM